MSRLSRRVARVAVAVLTVQLLGAVVIQVAFARRFRGQVIQELAGGLERSGGLLNCTARPGPWEHPEGWFSVWPLTMEGVPVGDGAPTARVRVPRSEAYVDWSEGEAFGIVYGSGSPECGGLLIAQRTDFPFLAADSSRVAKLIGLRLLLLPLSAIALVALTALPLVRRIRALSKAMRAVVDADFQGSVADESADEIGDVARAFDAATETARVRLERLEQRDAVLRHSMMDFAHDLRTPLATLALSASGLPPSSAATAIRAELGFLEGMTRNFEALLATDDEDPLANVAVNALFERVQHRFAPLARDRALAFDLALPDETLHVWAEPVALERALSNLVQNAVRFARGRVVLLLFREGNDVRLEVRDDGPGFGEFAARAAERGVRGDGGAGGSGLGLAIAESTARRFAGRLEFSTGDEQETLVALVLPAIGEEET